MENGLAINLLDFAPEWDFPAGGAKLVCVVETTGTRAAMLSASGVFVAFGDQQVGVFSSVLDPATQNTLGTCYTPSTRDC